MTSVHRTGTIALASLLIVGFAALPSHGYPWPKRRVVIGQAPVGTVIGQAPAAYTYGQAPATYTIGQAPTALSAPVAAQAPSYYTFQQAPAATSAAAPTFVISGAAPTTATATATAGAAPTTAGSTITINGQSYTLSAGSAPSTSSNEKCELTADDEAMIIEELHEYKITDLKEEKPGERRQQMIERAIELLQDYCDESSELVIRSRARKLVDEALAQTDAGLAPTSLGAAYAPAGGGYILQAAPAPAYAPQVMPQMVQPVVPVLLQPVQPHKCWRCLGRAFCPHKAY